MIIASAQTKPYRWNIDKNLSDHYKMIEIAAENRADLIVFPEMSISSYERENVSSLAFSHDDKRLSRFSTLASDYKMIIIAGAPILLKNNLYIGQYIFYPDGQISIYTKQYLHSGENLYFSSSFDYNPLIECGEELISLAICADIDNPKHPEDAKKRNCSLYIASIFFSKNGIADAHKMLSNYAEKYQMNVLMSNFAGSLWDTESGGRSAFWDQRGNLLEELDNSNPGILIVEKQDDLYSAKKLVYNNIRILKQI